VSRKAFRHKLRRLTAILTVLILTLSTLTTSKAHSTLAEESDIETAVCGWFREPFVFWLWRTLAGSPDPQHVAGIKDVERIQFKTRDGTSLSGYKLRAAKPKGYLLIAQGNAMLADQLVADLQIFRDLALDVHIYDYRGYGNSQGKSRLVAIVSDYAEIVSYLNSLGYKKRLLHGISMGGVILLNAIGKSQAYDRMVVDSSPSRISNLGCPERYDPVLHLSENSSRLMVISGAQDGVVPPSQMEDLIRVAGSRGARILRDKDFAHPYQDSSNAIHERRQREVAAFLLQD
jgi:alpha/beta superfamily hydrolase